MNNDPISEYFEALERLKAGCPIHVKLGTKITNDAVALEAGRGKGSIKKSRSSFLELISAIDSAAKQQAKEPNYQKEKMMKYKNNANDFRIELEAALGREISLLYEIYELKKQLAKLTGQNIIPIRPQ
ncbi:hypothetical protein UNDKW_4052 [Undibacterium sp. KW1]|uniref:hypothetical protein n=1 Tax=Undibacterium sp. KW1 TaxID=2058624 RepID=UPI001331DE7F|nr:hypothetical protein [Undibacterium sp. KW1]BBB62325.1 hypothetical protein UNDKW_4052 [Undibacterium sp. KW1]